jgi:DNA-binding NtrC family response regulator
MKPIDKTKEILVLRKKDSNCEDISYLSDRPDIQIITVETEKEATFMMYKHPGISTVLINTDLAHDNGYYTSMKIRSINPSVPIILLVNYSNFESMRLALMVGSTQVLKKPVSPAEMEAVVIKYSNDYQHQIQNVGKEDIT